MITIKFNHYLHTAKYSLVCSKPPLCGSLMGPLLCARSFWVVSYLAVRGGRVWGKLRLRPCQLETMILYHVNLRRGIFDSQEFNLHPTFHFAWSRLRTLHPGKDALCVNHTLCADASSLVTRAVLEMGKLDHLISLLWPPEKKNRGIFPPLRLIRLERLNFH